MRHLAPYSGRLQNFAFWQVCIRLAPRIADATLGLVGCHDKKFAEAREGVERDRPVTASTDLRTTSRRRGCHLRYRAMARRNRRGRQRVPRQCDRTALALAVRANFSFFAGLTFFGEPVSHRDVVAFERVLK